MSLCYDSEKWLIITLASVAITLTIGLVTLAHGQSISDMESEFLKCTAYKSTNLVVVGTDECLALLETTDYYISLGYTIKAVENQQVYLEKIK